MLSSQILDIVREQDQQFADSPHLKAPKYDPQTHYLEVADSQYYKSLISFRHIIKLLSDSCMGLDLNAKNIDLFMLTPSISSPMGPGSDSEAIPIKFGRLDSYLTDSSQFGFEPILMNSVDRAYCYLPSLRGETPDKRHLNQFYHCEIEIKGGLDDVMKLAEYYVKYLTHGVLTSENLLKSLSLSPSKTLATAERVKDIKQFKRITLDDACRLLEESGFGKLINNPKQGRDISSHGELKLAELLGYKEPFWVTHFDRDRVPFYQKPDPANKEKVLNADLIFPNILPNSFGGEILGGGQRQDTPAEMQESLARQGLSAEPYDWYIDLRSRSNYSMTSGFGLGIERYIAWILGLDNIRDAILYPRLKDVLTKP